MRILITGSRLWQDCWAIASAVMDAAEDVAQWADVTVVHGGAPGADRCARSFAVAIGARHEVHGADWTRYGRAAGPIRNQEMVDLGADVCLAFPLGESPGTRDCMRRAADAGIPVLNRGDLLRPEVEP